MDENRAIARLAASLARGDDTDRTAAQIADTVAAACCAIDAALTPIIGHRGVAALANRSLHVAARAHPWLRGALEVAPADMDPALLESLLRAQTRADAAGGGAAFLQTFHELLASLVGASLTERLLRSVWIQFLSVPTSQDTSP